MIARSDTAPIVLAAGGTGGHVFPAEALARALVSRGRAVAFMTDARGENFSDRVAGVETYRVRAGRFDRGLLGKAVGVAELMLGLAQARGRLRALTPAAVVGFGGYPSVPTVMAASLLHLPTVIHEQNAVLGRANRLLAPRVRRIATSFAEVAMLGTTERQRARHTGNPVRPAIAALATAAYTAPQGDTPFELLVLGGSQGARILSEVVPAALAALPDALRRQLRVSQQARPEDLDAVRRAYEGSGVVAELASFFGDVPQRLARAHLVIARSGASTVAELGAAGRPAILVPYPFAADNHQAANAAAFEASGGGSVLLQPVFTAEALARLLQELAVGPERLAAMAAAARAFGRPDAAERLADLVLATIAGSNGAGQALKEAA
jgi:UDP-N-acetylglucosamine--N-acetylmuramyl-(pentapeptide) pyrophosphoryl-undecaprenol N-acetylglucosamine transferase